MYGKTRLAAGMAICVVAALLMVTGVVGMEVGLVVGTVGMLIVATCSKTRNANQDNAT